MRRTFDTCDSFSCVKMWRIDSLKGVQRVVNAMAHTHVLSVARVVIGVAYVYIRSGRRGVSVAAPTLTPNVCRVVTAVGHDFIQRAGPEVK